MTQGDDRVLTGVEGLDAILKGGLPRNRLYLLEGAPGSGKTTLSLQFLLEGVRQGERCLYITLSETSEELAAVGLRKLASRHASARWLARRGRGSASAYRIGRGECLIGRADHRERFIAE